MKNLDFASTANAPYIEELYRRYQQDRGSVPEDWALFFEGFDFATGGGHIAGAEPTVGVFDLIHSYRELGHLVANLDPLGHNQTDHPLLAFSEFGFTEADLDRIVECPTFKYCSSATLRELVRLLRVTYCSNLGVEYMYIDDKAQRTWLQERMEPSLNNPQLSVDERKVILGKLIAAEGFEQYLHTKYVGQKRFSLEGAESLIPLLDELLERAAAQGVREVVMAMAHRGRLNVLANVLGKPYEMIFSEFEGSFLAAGTPGDGDVKYHLGYSRDHATRHGETVHLSLLYNPSHLEAINPVAQGIVRAKQHYRHDVNGVQVMSLQIHGDASFTGQGLVTETLALSELDAYATGGTIHVIVNNQIGFTTSPVDYRFTRYPSDFAKIIQVPVFHVNGDDPEAAVQAARLAVEFRNRFKKDVIIDLVCFRRYGHNEGDDPTFTQPRMYKEIAAHPGARAKYVERLVGEGVLDQAEVERITADLREVFDAALSYARDFMPRQQVFSLGGVWKGLSLASDDWSAQTAVKQEVLEEIVQRCRTLPNDFKPHPKVRRLLDDRAAMIGPEGRIDWGCGEMLAFGSLLLEGTDIRLSGEDTGRGTFSHRHAVLRDVETEVKYVPLNHLRPQQGKFWVIDSMLSEAAVLGFEYGFSSADPHNLVVWEAQFGDFANGAQVIIDQFIAAAESKWQRMSGLVMLLPHGYEGQGPEHSSARLERFLQLCAENNMQVCNLTTPAQLFHALRRQMHRTFRKPLVVMSPKSLLRHKLVVSSARDFTDGCFCNVLPEADSLDPKAVRRVLFCSGKIYYDLLLARREADIADIAILRVEQLYPFPTKEIAGLLQTYPNANEVFWVQEEPANMGAWSFVQPRLAPIAGNRPVSYVGREEAASPAVGSYKLHEKEQAEIVHHALRRPHAVTKLRTVHAG